MGQRWKVTELFHSGYSITLGSTTDREDWTFEEPELGFRRRCYSCPERVNCRTHCFKKQSVTTNPDAFCGGHHERHKYDYAVIRPLTDRNYFSVNGLYSTSSLFDASYIAAAASIISRQRWGNWTGVSHVSIDDCGRCACLDDAFGRTGAKLHGESRGCAGVGLRRPGLCEGSRQYELSPLGRQSGKDSRGCGRMCLCPLRPGAGEVLRSLQDRKRV